MTFEEDASALATGEEGFRIASARSFILTIDPAAIVFDPAVFPPTDAALLARDFALVEVVSFGAVPCGLDGAGLEIGGRGLDDVPRVDEDEVDELDAAEDGLDVVCTVGFEGGSFRETDGVTTGLDDDGPSALFEDPATDGEGADVATPVDEPFRGAPLTTLAADDEEKEVWRGWSSAVAGW